MQMAPVQFISEPDIFLLGLGAALILLVYRTLVQGSQTKARLTALKSPPSESWFFGCSRTIIESADAAPIYEQWRSQYGDVFAIPTVLGGKRVVLCDPKAITHFYAHESTTYVQSGLGKQFIKKFFGNGILVAEGENHRRQRKALTPAFSVAAIRRLTSVFYDSAHKAKNYWENTINESSSSSGDSALIDVQSWMNRIALDSIGIAGFAHDFHALDGHSNEFAELFDSLGSRNPGTFSMMLFLLSTVFPFVLQIPTARSRNIARLSQGLSAIADELLKKSKEEGEKGVTSDTLAEEKSLIGLLIKAEGQNAELYMTKDEVMAQMNVLILAGYETTSISLTWALLELSRKPAIQTKLREELLAFGSADPTLDQLTNQLPYLDAVVHEVLRTHPPVVETNRVATTDDIIPLSHPITTRTGQSTDHIVIPKGTRVSAPISMVNRTENFWGEDAGVFNPERWLVDGPQGKAAGDARSDGLKKNQIQGHRHLLTFSDGPRICLGKAFALAEFKAVLSVLVRNFEFRFPDGGEPNIVKHQGILPRPKYEGEEKARTPLVVRRLD